MSIRASSRPGPTPSLAGNRRRRPRPTWPAEIRDVAADLPRFLTAPLLRPWHRRWGASRNEVAATMPGDELFPLARYRCTRAITITATPDEVWPWLVQVGCLRAGWYADDLLDDLAHPSAREVVPPIAAPARWATGCRWPRSRHRRRRSSSTSFDEPRLDAVADPDQQLVLATGRPFGGRYPADHPAARAPRLATTRRRRARGRADGVRRLPDDATNAARRSGNEQRPNTAEANTPAGRRPPLGADPWRAHGRVGLDRGLRRLPALVRRHRPAAIAGPPRPRPWSAASAWSSPPTGSAAR